MKKMLVFLFAILICNACLPQDKFRNFIKNFKPLDFPIESILELTRVDTLDGKLTNDLIIRDQQKKPLLVDKNGDVKSIKQYYGLYPEDPDSFLKDVRDKSGKFEEKRLFFYPKIYPIGQLNINANYESLIIKVVGFETTFYDLWNFSKDGKALSVVCLFWGMRDEGPKDETVTFIIVDSKITADGNIIWHENADGLETFRTYKLNNDGLFQIIKEEKKGEAEF